MAANSVRLAVTTAIGAIFCASGAFLLACPVGEPSFFHDEAEILEQPYKACTILLHRLLWLAVFAAGLGMLFRRPSARLLLVATIVMAALTGIVDIVWAFISLPHAAGTQQRVMNHAYFIGALTACLGIVVAIVVLSALALAFVEKRAKRAESVGSIPGT
jgi:hypothetical protein